MTTKPEYPWMQHVAYEPRPTIQSGPTPIPFGWRVFLVIATLLMIGCGLAGLVVG